MSSTKHNALFNAVVEAQRIISPLVDVLKTSGEKKQANQDFNEQINRGTLLGYGECAVVIHRLTAQGLWNQGKQRGGGMSVSASLKAALEAEAAAKGVNASRAKRLIEKAVAIQTGKKAIPGVVEALKKDGGAADVVAALKSADIKREADLIRHVEGNPGKDLVANLLKQYAKLDEKQQTRFIVELNKLNDEPAADAA